MSETELRRAAPTGRGKAGSVLAEPRYRIDPRTLREVPEDRDEAEAWVSCGAGTAAGRISWLRILGRLTEAESAALAAFEAAGGHARPLPLAAVLPGIRLAQVLHWQGRLVAALRLLARVGATLSRSADSPAADSARAFLHQHRGKILLDAGHPGWALADFRQGLRLRSAFGAPQDQLESAEQAVSAALHASNRQHA